MMTTTTTMNAIRVHLSHYVRKVWLPAALCLLGCGMPGTASNGPLAFGVDERFELPEPGPMIPPVPAIVLGVAGDEEGPGDLAVAWTFVLDGDPPLVGISVIDTPPGSGRAHVALGLIEKHGEFTLNVPDATWLDAFDAIDMTSSERMDKFAHAGLTRLPSKLIGAPGIAEAALVLECRVLQSHSLPPRRRVFFAEVLRVSAHPGITDETGRLDSRSHPFFGMTSGNGEFWSFGLKLGHIGMSAGRTDIRY